jgi:hypothetical protein
MVEQRSRFRSADPDFEGFSEDITGRRARPYAFGRSARSDFEEDSAPLFLSEQEEEFLPEQDADPDTWEAGDLLPKQKSSVSLKILMGVLAASAVAMLFALFTSDAMRDAIDSAKASFAAVLPVPSANAQPETTQLTARDIQLKDPTRLTPPGNRTSSAPNQVAMVSPSREDIQNAYQSALQRAPSAAPPMAAPAPVVPAMAPPMVSVPPPPAAPAPVFAAPPVAAPVAMAPSAVAPPPVVGPMALPSPTASPTARRIDPDELAMLMKRAKSLLASGDIPPARLLLERAADAQEPIAAFLLAQTYDPEVLRSRDARSITPDLESARTWYQKAAQLGSADAQRRLAQMQN